MAAAPIAIYRFKDWCGEAAMAEIDQIFFEASSVRSFPSNEARQAFRERWLGRYLGKLSRHAFLAVRRARIVGYIVGSSETGAMFADIPSTALFADLLPLFPAHLHINVAAEARGDGVGSRLIDAFLAHMRGERVKGVHLVTSEGNRNIAFYERNGFKVEASRPADDRVLVFMARQP